MTYYLSYKINLNAEDTIDINYLNMIANQLSIEEIKTVNDYFSKFKFCINASEASKFLSNKNKKDYLIYLKAQISKIIKFDTDYFDKVFKAREQLLSNLVPVDNYDLPKYKHNSATGRSKIVGGTNFMTMKKNVRKNLTYKNFKVFEARTK